MYTVHTAIKVYNLLPVVFDVPDLHNIFVLCPVPLCYFSSYVSE